MKLGLIDNAWWYSSVDTVSGIKIAKEIGFDSYDLMPREQIQAIEKKRIREKLVEVGLEPSAITFAGFSLIDLNPSVRNFTSSWLADQLDVAYDIGCNMMVLALGEYDLEKQELSPKEQWQWAVEGVRAVGHHAKDLGMTIALETLAHKMALLNSAELVSSFIRDVGLDNVKVNADLSHFYLNGDHPEALKKKLNGLVAHSHISDCKEGIHGDLPTGRGDVPLRSYLQALKDMGFDGSVMVELEWNNQPGKIREWVKEAYDSTARMMDELGIRG